MRKFVRTWLPGIRLLIAYSDPSQGHSGTVYEADGWAPYGMTTHKNGYGWKSRPNRNDDPVTPKQTMGQDAIEREAMEASQRVRRWFRQYVLMGLAPIEKGKPRPSDSKVIMTADFKIKANK